MATSSVTGVDRLLAKALVPLCAVSGGVVLAGFFFPEFVGEAVSGRVWLTVSLLFFCSGLGYLAVLPYPETDEESTSSTSVLRIHGPVFRDLAGEFRRTLDPVTLGVPAVAFALFFCVQVVAPGQTTALVDAVSRTILREASVVFLGAVLLSVGYCLLLLFGSWGDIKLGGPDVEPTYTYPTYFALVFAAGIAAGIVFWGPAEALFHYQNPPPYLDAAPRSEAALSGALVYAVFHWGLSAWSTYAVVGVPVAYFVFVRDAPLRVSTVLAPVLGVDGLDSPWSRLVDTLAVFATVGGIATSIALVSEQFLAGISFQWGVSAGPVGPVLFVAGLTVIYVLSSVTGIHRGIRRIAGLNVVLFALFAAVVLAVGPRSFVVEQGARALSGYAVHFLPMSVYTGGEWVANWTVWNWSWWFSWAPFAGLFVAALSRGRRIRTVVFTSVVATSLATVLWFLLLGGTSLFVQHTGRVDVLAAVAARGGNEAVTGFPLFAALPLGQLLMFLFLALIVVFIVTSADTSTLVAAILGSRRGVAPSTGSIAFWGVFQGAVAVAVLLVGGAETLQALAVLTGGPFAVIALVALGGLTVTFLRRERGHTSVLGHLRERLPAIQLHHDVDPPDRDRE